jgi:hypothetical protein
MDIKRRHNQERKYRKNILPALLIGVIFWITTSFIFLFIDPNTTGAVFYLLASLFAALFFTCSIVLANVRRGLFVSLGFVVLLLFQYWKVGSVFNTLLVIIIFSLFEVYFQANS